MRRAQDSGIDLLTLTFRSPTVNSKYEQRVSSAMAPAGGARLWGEWVRSGLTVGIWEIFFGMEYYYCLASSSHYASDASLRTKMIITSLYQIGALILGVCELCPHFMLGRGGACRGSNCIVVALCGSIICLARIAFIIGSGESVSATGSSNKIAQSLPLLFTAYSAIAAIIAFPLESYLHAIAALLVPISLVAIVGSSSALAGGGGGALHTGTTCIHLGLGASLVLAIIYIQELRRKRWWISNERLLAAFGRSPTGTWESGSSSSTPSIFTTHSVYDDDLNMTCLARFLGDSISPVECLENATVKKVANTKKKNSDETFDSLLRDQLLDWDIDMFALESSLHNCALAHTASYFIRAKNLHKKFNISLDTLSAWSMQMQEGYLDHPYHNATHAADVLNSYCFLLFKGELSKHTTDIEYLACIIAAVIHDFRHPGFNNHFLKSIRSYKAVMFHRATLENFHLAAAFSTTLSDDKINIFRGMDQQTYKEVSTLVADLVLATDMAAHNSLVDESIRHLEENGKFDLAKKSERHHVLKVAMKCADVGHSCKCVAVHSAWSRAIQQEHFVQGDWERKLGLPVTPMMDRKQSEREVIQSQINFLVLCADPLYALWGRMVSDNFLLNRLRANTEHWTKRMSV